MKHSMILLLVKECRSGPLFVLQQFFQLLSIIDMYSVPDILVSKTKVLKRNSKFLASNGEILLFFGLYCSWLSELVKVFDRLTQIIVSKLFLHKLIKLFLFFLTQL